MSDVKVGDRVEVLEDCLYLPGHGGIVRLVDDHEYGVGVYLDINDSEGYPDNEDHWTFFRVGELRVHGD